MDLLKLRYEHQFSIELKIKKAELEALKDSNGSWNSQHYIATKSADLQYYFEVLPYGDDEETAGKTTIYLHISLGNVKEVKAKCKIFIESMKWSSYFEDIYDNSDGTGLMSFKSEEFFNPANNFFVNDEFVIKFNGTLKFDRPSISKESYPFFTKWTIKSVDLEPLQTSINGYLKSEKFIIPSNPDIKYFNIIYPNGDDDEDRGKVILYLCIEFQSKVEYSVRVRSEVKFGVPSESLNADFEESKEIGFAISSTKDLFDATKGYIIDGELTIKSSGHMFIEKKESCFVLLGNGISDEQSAAAAQEKNFVIVVDRREIYVNKDLLANVSTVFSGMMKSGMKETIENKTEIPDFPFKTVDSAMKLIYGISPTFTLEDMLPLLVFADKYDIQIIKELVESYLIRKLTTSNGCQLIHFSNLFNAPKLYEKSAEFLVQCYKDSVSVNDLDLLDKGLFYKIFYGSFGPITC